MSSIEALPKEVRSKSGKPPRVREDTARHFLSAALEILETPASPVRRMIGATIILFFALAVTWAVFGHVDIIATAQGKIVPTGRTKTIQPLETGIVSAIHVQDGDNVVAGQVLIELDRTVTQAEQNISFKILSQVGSMSPALRRFATALNRERFRVIC
jgi:multidrug efflux pump subunit AcrA (membrane-fusion protein)